MVQSKVYSANIENRTVVNLGKPIVLAFKKENHLIGNETCQYWNFNKGRNIVLGLEIIIIIMKKTLWRRKYAQKALLHRSYSSYFKFHI